jgi:phosphate transport system permease protein
VSGTGHDLHPPASPPAAAVRPAAPVLRGSRLPRWAVPALGAAAVAATPLLFAATPLHGRGGFAVVAALLYLAASSAAGLAVEGRRRAVDRLATSLVHLAFVLAVVPLVLILWKVVAAGAGAVDLSFLTHSMFRVNPDGPGGGIYHALVGTLEQSFLATAIAAPVGILTAVYLVEYGEGGRFARLVGFFVDVMTGVPSIVAGLFVYTAWILVLGFNKAGFAGSLALFILMLPMVVRSSEEMLRLVPGELREAAYALGIPRWRTILRIVLPTATGGIVTGVMLGVARIMGETAPLLLLVGINARIETNPFAFGDTQRPQESLPTFIYEQFQNAAGATDSPPFERAWGAALALIVLVMLLNAVARAVAGLARTRRK